MTHYAGCIKTTNKSEISQNLMRLLQQVKKFLGFALLFKSSENLLESKPFKMLRKRPYFKKNPLCACLIYACA